VVLGGELCFARLDGTNALHGGAGGRPAAAMISRLAFAPCAGLLSHLECHTSRTTFLPGHRSCRWSKSAGQTILLFICAARWASSHARRQAWKKRDFRAYLVACQIHAPTGELAMPHTTKPSADWAFCQSTG
jgi:hypothetical protein